MPFAIHITVKVEKSVYGKYVPEFIYHRTLVRQTDRGWRMAASFLQGKAQSLPETSVLDFEEESK